MFILPYLTTLGMAYAVRAASRDERLVPVSVADRWKSLAAQLPPTPRRRGLVMALAVMVVLAPTAVAILGSLHVHRGVEPSSFVFYKTVLGVALGAVFTPIAALVTLARAESE
jgi:hypothetical protein